MDSPAVAETDFMADLFVGLVEESTVGITAATVIAMGVGMGVMDGLPSATTVARLPISLALITIPIQPRTIHLRRRTIHRNLWLTRRRSRSFTIFLRLLKTLKVRSTRCLQ